MKVFAEKYFQVKIFAPNSLQPPPRNIFCVVEFRYWLLVTQLLVLVLVLVLVLGIRKWAYAENGESPLIADADDDFVSVTKHRGWMNFA